MKISMAVGLPPASKNKPNVMKKVLLTLVLFAFAAFVGGSALTAQNLVDQQGRRQGHWVKTDKDGSKIFEGNFKDGFEIDTFRYFYPDGSLRILNVFAPGTRRCSHQAYDKQGRMLAKGFYNQKNRDGRWEFFDEEGRMVKYANYRMGVLEGEQVIFTSKGDTAEVSHWRDNQRHGRWWKRIGLKGFITATYKDGGIEGRLEERDDEQRLVREATYADGLCHGFCNYYEEGVLSVKEQWSRGFCTERLIRIMKPEAEFINIKTIACLAPKGNKKVTLLQRDGKSYDTYEPADNLYYRLGNTDFAYANKKNRIIVALDCVVEVYEDKDSQQTRLRLNPEAPFAIYPDEDCIKMVRATQFQGTEPLLGE